MKHNFSLNIERHNRRLQSVDLTRKISRHNETKDYSFFKVNKRSDTNHESGSTQRQPKYPTIWMKCRHVSCSKVTKNISLIKNINWYHIPLIYPLGLMSSFLFFKKLENGNKCSIYPVLWMSPISHALWTWERSGSFTERVFQCLIWRVQLKKTRCCSCLESLDVLKKTLKKFCFVI